MIKKIIYFLFFLIIIYLIYINFYIKHDIYFNSSIETQNFLLKDEDNYVNNFSFQDLHARKVKDKNEYFEIIKKNCLDFNETQKNKLIKCCKIADNFLYNYKNYYINGSNISKIKWIFSLIGNNYEEGFPHTRQNIIFLSNNVINNDDNNIIQTLIHEKIHIYQRYNDMTEIINLMNYKFSRKKYNIKNLRSNPDLDDNIYKDSNNKELIFLYKNDYPTSINDIIGNNFSIEHPFEKMAYDISYEYNKLYLDKYINI